MKKGQEKTSFWTQIHIPAPRVISDAFARVKRPQYDYDKDPYKNYVGHHSHGEGSDKEKKGDRWKILDGEEHGFYLGKFVRGGVFQKIRKIMGWGEQSSGIYSPEFIEGMLDYAFARHTENPNGKINIFLCPVFTKLFNGPSESEIEMMSPEEQKELIFKIAKKRWGGRVHMLNVVDIEEVSAHKPLLDLLKGSVKKDTGLANPKVLESDNKVDLGENPTSLDIAKYLYNAIKNNQVLQEIFKNLPTQSLQEEDRYTEGRENESDEFLITPRICYGLTEIAIRLWEVLNGRFIHGGVDRQGKYDEFIKKIVLGKTGGLKKIKELKELFKLFEGKRFDTIHVSTEKNPCKLSADRTIARIRLMLFAVLGLGITIGAYQIGSYAKDRENAAIKQEIDNRLGCLLEDSAVYVSHYDRAAQWRLSTQGKVERFGFFIRDIKKEIRRRYGLSNKNINDLEPFLMQYFITERGDMDRIVNSWYFALDKLDSFMKKEEFYFLSRGIKTGRPYQSFFEYFDLIKQGMEENDPGINLLPGFNQDRFIRLGEISVPDHDGKIYTLYIYYFPDVENEGILTPRNIDQDVRPKVYLLASSNEMEMNGREAPLSSANGLIAGRAFIETQKKFDIKPFEKYALYFDELYKGLVGADCNFEIDSDSFMGRLPNYTDFMGRFDYELALYSDVDEEGNFKGKHLVARAPGDKYFTTFRACEAAQYYAEAGYIREWPNDVRDEVRAKISSCTYLEQGPKIHYPDYPRARSLNSYPRVGEKPLKRPMRQHQYRSSRKR